MNTKPKISSPFRYLTNDLSSGLVVFLVALPLCLGIALASGAPLFSGLISGIIGGIVIGSLSGSRYSVSGPAAGLTVIVLNAIAELGSFDVFLLAVFIAGALQVVMGLVKAGIIGLYFPTSVIKGMLAAIGLILILKEIPHFFGVDTQAFGEMDFAGTDGRNTFEEFAYALEHIHNGALVVGAFSLLLILIWDGLFVKKIPSLKFVPSALLAVVGSIVINEFLFKGNPEFSIGAEHLVFIPTVGEGSYLDLLSTPDFTQIFSLEVWKVAFIIAMIASLETLLSLEAVDKLDPEKRNSPKNRELLAQGTGNMLSGLIGGLPITAVIVRSSTNIGAGAKTKLSAIIHGILLLVCVLSIPHILQLIPLSTLAAVLLVVGYKLTKPALYKEQWRFGYKQFIPFVVTVLAILVTNLLTGIIIGMAVGFIFILHANYLYSVFTFEEQDGSGNKRFVMRLSEHISFLNKAALQKALENLPEDSEVLIDGSNTKEIDFDALVIIRNFILSSEEKNIQVSLKNLNMDKFKEDLTKENPEPKVESREVSV